MGNFQNRMCQPLQSALLGNTSAEKAVRQMVREADTLLQQAQPGRLTTAEGAAS